MPESFSEQSMHAALQQLQKKHLYRHRRVIDSAQSPQVVVEGKSLLSFCSNDYLGLANHPDVRQAMIAGVEKYGAGSGASHLVSGHTRAHEALEEALADFTGRDRALVFSSGYMANVGVLTSLLKAGDRVYEDRLNHASLLDGGLFSGARFSRYAHADTEALKSRLSGGNGGRALIVTDGVFSMDGDLAPLPALADLARENNAWLMVDDAHGIGCIGAVGGGTTDFYSDQGRPVTQEDCQILIGTLGKAFGTAGAFVAGSEALIETLIQTCRPYIYTTAQPAAVACATLKSLEILREEHWRRERLAEMIRRFRIHCQGLDFKLTHSITPIQAIILNDESEALAASRFLEERGLLITAIRPPTVPAGTSRLRVTFSAAHTEEQLSVLLQALTDLAESTRVSS